ncbi:MAG: TraB/GumN family protein, partial [Asticcacaulis sp.]|nr:TraB/GumN family protein [Asticcacaulis sp.]
MTKSIRIEEVSMAPARAGPLAWVRDVGIVATAAVCVAVTTVAAGIALHGSRNAAPVIAFAGDADPSAAEAQAGPMGAPLLWVVRTETSTVYLFGSVHLMPAGAEWMDQRLFAAFDGADQVWFESPNLDRLPPVGDNRLSAGADAALFRRARVLDKRVGGFERNRSPLGRYGTGFSDDGVNVSLDAWRKGDQKAMTQQVAARAKSDPEIYRLLLSERNQAWL